METKKTRTRKAEPTPEPASAPAQTNPTPALARKGPIKVFRLDDVSAAIFARVRTARGEEMTFYSVDFTRSYKASDGVWKYTRSFDPEDLGKVITVAQRAAEFADERRQQRAEAA